MHDHRCSDDDGIDGWMLQKVAILSKDMLHAIFGGTFGARSGTAFSGLRKPEEDFVRVVTLLAYGCPRQAIVKAFELDEPTVARWEQHAGQQCERMHQRMAVQAGLDVIQVQADEIRVKGVKWVAWMGLALMVSSRLWLAAEVSMTRESGLADRLLLQVRACVRQGIERLLVCTDGWNAYVQSIRRAFREPVRTHITQRGGRPRWRAWSGLVIGQESLRTITREVTHGSKLEAEDLLQCSQGGGQLNTSFIERLNATMRERLAYLSRRTRHAAHRLESLRAGMYLIGCTYNFCWPHHEVSRTAQRVLTPAMAAGVTDHVWSVEDVLRFWVPPPPLPTPARKRGRQPKREPLVLRKRRGRPPKASRTTC
jgi:IS1 family transposase